MHTRSDPRLPRRQTPVLSWLAVRQNGSSPPLPHTHTPPQALGAAWYRMADVYILGSISMAASRALMHPGGTAARLFHLDLFHQASTHTPACTPACLPA